MLYISTRNKADAYTALHALQKNTCANGSWFVPVQIPAFTPEQLSELHEKSFCQCVADVLNLFFNARLDAKDVEFCIGKRPIQVGTMSHKIMVAEFWHNPSGTFCASVNKLVRRILGSEQIPETPGNWAKISVLTAFLFGVYAQMLQGGLLEQNCSFDVAVGATDFSGTMAVWYARKMGLPIRTVICGCDDNGALWDLIYYGTVSNAERITPDAEQYIYHTLGQTEAVRFAASQEAGKAYTVSEEQCALLREGLFAAVVSTKRITSVMNSVYRTNSYVLEPDSALAFSGLQDYRTGAGETVPALIIMKDSPACSTDAVTAALGITAQALLERIRNR